MYVLKLKRRTNLLKVSVVAAAVMLAACFVALEVRVEPSQASYPGKNGKIAFTSYSGGGSTDILSIDPDGSDQTRLSGGSKPTWSPDGTKIAFTQADDIYVMNADGSNQTNLTNDPAWEGRPAWSPDGTKIAFDSGRDGNSEIYVMNAADGSDVSRLSEGFMPAWSPDGTKIAFASYPDGTWREEIYVMNAADGSDVSRLTYSDRVSDLWPRWSPDGTKIAYARSWEGTWRRPGDDDIYTMNPDGSHKANLTGDRARLGIVREVFDWSPDGTKIAFTSWDDDIYTMNADGSDLTALVDSDTSSGYYNFGPQWSPDGTKIAFESDGRDNWYNCAEEICRGAVYTMNAADGSDVTRITSNADANDGSPDWQALPAPTTKAECKNGGYEQFGFTNQGQCIASVQRAAKSE
jgi:Tol biopolymer transport system component